jgi:hypothetical protein
VYQSGSNGIAQPVLLDHTGRPIRSGQATSGARGISLPHAFTVIADYRGADYTYLHSRFDEALRHGREDAEVMRRDCYLMALLQERQLAVSGLNWHLEVPDDKDPDQARVRDGLTRIISGIPHLRRILYWLTEALWYGRYGVQLAWEWSTFMDRPGKRDTKSPQQLQQEMMGGGGDEAPRGREARCLSVADAWPVNGDKIGYQHDHTPYVLIRPGMRDHLPNAATLVTTVGGEGLSLRGSWRDRFIIHKHLMEDTDFFNPEQADAVHGVGIRSKLFWVNWLKLEWLANVTNFFDQVGLGMTLWKYPAGNDAARQEALSAALSQSSRAHVLVPVWGEAGREALTGVDRVEVPTAGCEGLVKLIEYLDRHMERYVVGQSGSAAPGPSGIGNEFASEMMASTKNQITIFDAQNLAVTLTGTDREPGLVNTIKRWTFPGARFPVTWKFDIEKVQSSESLNAVRSLVELGLDVKADDVRAAAGLSKPAEGDEVVKPPAQPGAPGMMPGGAPGAPAPGEGGGDFLAALQMSRAGRPLQYDWQNMGVVKVSPSGLPLFRWYDPAVRQARIQHVKPGEGRRKGQFRFRGKGPGRTRVAELDVGRRSLRLIGRILKLMFPGGWVRPGGLPALVGAGHGTGVIPYPRRDADGALVIELRPEEGGHWELVLGHDGSLTMDPPGEPSEAAVRAMSVAGVDACGGQDLPEDALPRGVARGNERRRRLRLENADRLMEMADRLLARPDQHEGGYEDDPGAGAPEPQPDPKAAPQEQTPGARLGAVLAHLRQSGRHEVAEAVALAYARRRDTEAGR